MEAWNPGKKGILPLEKFVGCGRYEVHTDGIARHRKRSLMDIITTSLLKEFSEEYGFFGLDEDKQFEHFAAFITVRSQYSETFSPEDIVVGSGGDLGIDAIAIIANGALVTDVDSFNDLMSDGVDYLDVSFIFVQAERSPSFDGQKLLNFVSGVKEFFDVDTKEPRSEDIMSFVDIMKAVYSRSSKFKSGNPHCRPFYVTTGKWMNDASLASKITKSTDDLKKLEIFRDVEIIPIGASEIQKLYGLCKNSIAREFTFQFRQDIPEIPGVKEAFVGFISAKDFLPIVCNESGEMVRSIFYDNVRDFQGYGTVNNEIKTTLLSDKKQRFILMNNGITIIARDLTRTGSKFHVEDFQIVNGCQTTHVLYDQKDSLSDDVLVPLRLICTQDEDVIQDVIQATNKQTEIKNEQFFAVTEFARQLEVFFKGSSDESHRLFYERRSRQYDRLSIEKTRISTQVNVIRSFAAVFMCEPHSTSRSYKSLSDRIGKDIFAEGHKCDPYYSASLVLYRLEWLFRNKGFDSKYKIARFQLLLAARLLSCEQNFPLLNAKKIESYCAKLNEIMFDADTSEILFREAAGVIDQLCPKGPDRDTIHTTAFTTQLIAACVAKNAVPKAIGG
jgi:AIPR protein